MNTCLSSNEASISFRRKHIWMIADTLIRADLRADQLKCPVNFLRVFFMMGDLFAKPLQA